MDKDVYQVDSAYYVGLGCTSLEEGDAAVALDAFSKAITLDDKNDVARSYYLMASHYLEALSREESYLAHCLWDAYHAKRIQVASAFSNSAIADRRLRVGYLVPDFKLHPIPGFIESILQHHNTDDFEIILYIDSRKPDELTDRLSTYASQCHNIYDYTDTRAKRFIRDDGIDILVDLVGHGMYNRLQTLAWKPAPVIITGIGYPDTTGISVIDYRLCDEFTEPEGNERYASETLLRIENCSLSYTPPADVPPVEPLPAQKSGQVTFASFNELARITPRLLVAWCDILKALPDARLVITTDSFNNPQVLENYLKKFEAHGVDRARLSFHGLNNGTQSHMAMYNSVDIVLDTYPYNGDTTTCEALWMGVPVVTLKGDAHCARVGYSLMHSVGLDDWVADSHDEYTRIAVNNARNTSALAELRDTLRDTMAAAPLCDTRGYTRRIEEHYRDCWHRWCNTIPEDEQLVEKGAEIAVLYSLPRSGGTLISRCLGAIEGNVLLSEVNPGNSVIAPLTQAFKWFSLLSEDEYNEFTKSGSYNYLQAIRLIHKRCKDTQQSLIVRDLSHIDYFGFPFTTSPSGTSKQKDVLSADFNINAIALVRHPVDLYLSLTKLSFMKGFNKPELFLKAYKLYADMACDTGFIRYEDFCHTPIDSLKLICRCLKVNFEDTTRSFARYNTITGDNMAKSQVKRAIIKVIRRKRPNNIVALFEKNADYQSAIEMLGYKE